MGWITIITSAWKAVKWAKALVPQWALDGFEKAFHLLSDSDIAKYQIDASIEIANIKAEGARRKEQTEQLRIDSGWWVTRLIRPSFAYLVLVYWVAMHARALWHWDGGVWDPVIPHYMIMWGDFAVLNAFFIGRGFEKVYRLKHRSE